MNYTSVFDISLYSVYFHIRIILITLEELDQGWFPKIQRKKISALKELPHTWRNANQKHTMCKAQYDILFFPLVCFSKRKYWVYHLIDCCYFFNGCKNNHSWVITAVTCLVRYYMWELHKAKQSTNHSNQYHQQAYTLKNHCYYFGNLLSVFFFPYMHTIPMNAYTIYAFLQPYFQLTECRKYFLYY